MSLLFISLCWCFPECNCCSSSSSSSFQFFFFFLLDRNRRSPAECIFTTVWTRRKIKKKEEIKKKERDRILLPAGYREEVFDHSQSGGWFRKPPLSLDIHTSYKTSFLSSSLSFFFVLSSVVFVFSGYCLCRCRSAGI